jgi:ssDNA-binding Zn-finger/Zn-ribbon topoisomerase 1
MPDKFDKTDGNAEFKTKSETAKTDEELIENKRKEAFLDPKTQDVLRYLLQSGDEKDILPVFTLGVGYTYSILDNNATTPYSISQEFLENLVKIGLMQRKFFDSAAGCPHCSSTLMTIHNRCPRCKSHNVEKTSLTEHIPCGYIDQKENYLNNHCPKCNDLLVAGQFRNMGQWYMCHDCAERFEIPEFDLICRSCGKWFATKEAKVVGIGKYSLDPQRKREIRQNVASIENVRKVLIDLGFTVQMPGLAIGQKSKMQHNFSLIATKNVDDHETVIALDHAVSETEVSVSPLIVYIYKTSEVKVDIPIFVALPQLNATARQIAQGHEILLIEGFMDEKELAEKVRSRLGNARPPLKQSTGLELLPNTEIQKENNSLMSKFKVFKKT